MPTYIVTIETDRPMESLHKIMASILCDEELSPGIRARKLTIRPEIERNQMIADWLRCAAQELHPEYPLT